MDTVAVSLLIIRPLMGSSGLRTRLTVKVSRDSFSSSSLIVISTGITVVLSLKISTLVSESKSIPAEQEGTVKQLKKYWGVKQKIVCEARSKTLLILNDNQHTIYKIKQC